MHGGDRVAEVLRGRGVRFVFTLCGGHISPILVACKQRGIRVVDVRHEATAVFAADAVARITGVPGVAAVTAGPGATNTITAVKNAQLARSPLVLLVGGAPTALRGRGALQDIDQAALFRPHVKRFTPVRRVRDVAPAVARALALAKQGVPGPVAVELPVDLLYDESTVREWYGAASGTASSLAGKAVQFYLRRHVERMFAGADTTQTHTVRADVPDIPSASRVGKAARRLADAQRPVLVIGGQALLEPEEVHRLVENVERIGAPVYLTGMARGLLGRDHPLHLRHARRKALREADWVLLAGVPCDFRLDYGKQISRRAFLVGANRSRFELRQNRKPDLAVPGDPGIFLRELAERCRPNADRDTWIATLRERDETRETEIAEQARASTEFLNPLALCRAVEDVLPDDSVLVADGGDFVGTASYIVRPRGPLRWLDPGAFGTLGVGAGFALGAGLCRPDAEVWVLFGDGSFGYSLAEFDTLARHAVPVIAVIGNDACWTQIARAQVEILRDDVGCALERTDYHRAVEGLGARGFEVRDPDALSETLRLARETAAGGKPVVINAHIGQTDFRKGSLSM